MSNFYPHSNLPPSQGGKYSGFGNSAYVPPARSSSVDVYDSLASVIIIIFKILLI